MAKRKVVPVALHSELSEYSSLLRALRTENTLDIVSHLTKDHSSVSPYDKGDETDEDSPSNTSRTPVEGSSRGPTRSVSPKSGETRNGPSTQTTGDTWTRWPMLAGDVHVPEWSFQDEVKLLAIQALQQQRKSGSEGDQSPSDEEVKEEDIFDSSFLNALTVASSTHLSQILSLLAAHIPQAEKSMQNRIKPLRWENVLDIMATSGFVDEKSIENIQSRLEAIYGPSESAAVERARLNTLMKDKLDDMFSGSTSSLLEPPPSPPPRPRKRRKRTGVEVKIESSGD